jgi:hypothetical protein
MAMWVYPAPRSLLLGRSRRGGGGDLGAGRAWWKPLMRHGNHARRDGDGDGARLAITRFAHTGMSGRAGRGLGWGTVAPAGRGWGCVTRKPWFPSRTGWARLAPRIEALRGRLYSPCGTTCPLTSSTGTCAPQALAPAIDPQPPAVGELRQYPTRARPWPSQGVEGPGGAG